MHQEHTGRRDIGASQWRGDRPALRAAAPTQRGLRTLQPSARASRREGAHKRRVFVVGSLDTQMQDGKELIRLASAKGGGYSAISLCVCVGSINTSGGLELTPAPSHLNF